MAETKFPKRRAFAMQKPRKTERTESPRRTERQRAADKRRREEARAMGGYAKGPKTPEKRMTALQPHHGPDRRRAHPSARRHPEA